MYEEINKHISDLGYLTPSEIELFNSKLEYREVKRKTFLLRSGEVCNDIIFIRKGCLRSFYINSLGAKITVNFGVENWWMVDIASFHDRTPSKVFIETLENSELLFLSHKNQEELYQKIPAFNAITRKLLEKRVASMEQRLMLLVTEQARERYLDFLNRYSNIARRVTQLQIATYLGITPEFLSKTKRELKEEGII
ncbi:MAG: Crp/Fnr family transcriptional regulator [Flavobacteriales bacterium]|nr:Crp/Fnr family transcriptional regulator [Flavobacteriales bacterium]